MDIKKSIIVSIKNIIKEDKKNIFYLFYYSIIEAILVLSIPLASSFIINSILSHATISIFVLGFVVTLMFILATFLQIIKEYIVEKFQQKIFVNSAIKIAKLAIELKESNVDTKQTIDKYMNYFFDISAIQKIFPILLLDGTALIIKIIVSLLLLLAFEPILFTLGLFGFIFYLIMLYLLGNNGIQYAIARSDAKHSSIYYLQHIPYQTSSNQEVLEKFDGLLIDFIKARGKIFMVTIKQLTLTFIMEGLIFSGFIIIGGYLVVQGTLPLGEFVASEIVVVSITYALKGFMKQIDYIYDMIEGVYKVNKLSSTLGEKIDV